MDLETIVNEIREFRQSNQPGNIPHIIELCQSALDQTDRKSNLDIWLNLCVTLGDCFLDTYFGERLEYFEERSENIEKAIDYYEQALEVTTKKAMPSQWANIINSLAVAYMNRIQVDREQNVEKAIYYYKMALEVVTSQDMPIEWAITIHNLGIAYMDRIQGVREENIEQAIICFNQALEVRTRENMPMEWADTKYRLAYVYLNRMRGDRAENIERAITYSNQALEVRTIKAMPVEWADTIVQLATAYYNRIRENRAENLEKAIDYNQQALKVITRHAMPAQWSRIINNLAYVYIDRILGERAENLEKAINYCQQALEIRTKQTMPSEWADTKCTMANAYTKRILGEPADNIEKAIKYYEQALEVKTHQGMPIEWAITIHNLAIAYRNRILGEPADNIDKAIKYYEQVLEVTAQHRMPSQWAMIVNNLANAYYNRIQGDKEENIEKAIDYYEQALQVTTRQAMPLDWAETTNNLASAYYDRIMGDRAKNIKKAIGYYEQSLEVRTSQALPDFYRQTQRNLGHLYFNEGYWDQSATAYRDTLDTSNLLYQIAATPEARQAELREIRDIPGRLAYALVKTSDNPWISRDGVLALEQNRARWLSEALALQSDKPSTMPEVEWQAFITQRDNVQDLLAEARLPEDTPDKQDFLTLTGELRSAQGLLAETIERVRKYDDRFIPETDFRSIQTTASKAKCPLVYFAVTTAGTLALIVSPSISADSNTADVYPVWCDLTENDLKALLVQEVDGNEVGYLPAQLGLTNMAKALKEVLPKLGTSLMSPIVKELRKHGFNSVILIPGGLLSLLPLGAAQIDGPLSKDGYAFLDEFDTAYAPSGTAIGYSYRKMEDLKFEPQQVSLLAVGDPPHRDAQRLPFALAEIEDISSYFPSDKQQLLPEEKATREAIIAGASNTTVLHFSCHGEFDPKTPLNSALLLTGDDRLTLSDILNNVSLDKCRLTVLSACQTAITDYQKLPDEVIGLPGGFLSAGVPGVIGTLWPVNDISTALLMERFYYYYRHEGLTLAAALGAAQRWLRDITNEELGQVFETRKETAPDGPRMPYKLAQDKFVQHMTRNPQDKPFSSPHFWAPFTVNGI